MFVNASDELVIRMECDGHVVNRLHKRLTAWRFIYNGEYEIKNEQKPKRTRIQNYVRFPYDNFLKNMYYLFYLSFISTKI
jgi:hypothetical protein